ncbi:MAG: zinc metallopeptidase [Clostridiales bacterium]|nr:zinc metallopeptidase [Clostridiales bacterium]
MMSPFHFDPTMMILIPAILLAGYAQIKVQSTFAQYSSIAARSGLTGAQVARGLLDSNRLGDVPVEMTGGMLSDHYDPRTKVLRLSRDVYQSNSLAALGVAAHEVGHVLQDEHGYILFNMRSLIVPLANIGSRLSFPLLFLGLIMRNQPLARIGVYAFAFAVLFQLVTLPVELNASRRAIELLSANGYIDTEEVRPTKKVLRAAALTYVAATLMAILQFLRLGMLSGMFGRRRD